jgi:hypothetical protein
MNGIEWPHLLADLTAKRDALNEVIKILTSQFTREIATPPATLRRSKTAAKRNERTNERTSKARANGTALTEPP